MSGSMTRREFVGSAVAGIVVGAGRKAYPKAAAGASGTTRPVPPRNRRPYAGLDWSKVICVKTTSHGHCQSQWWLDQYLKRGFGLITMSNYYLPERAVVAVREDDEELLAPPPRPRRHGERAARRRAV